MEKLEKEKSFQFLGGCHCQSVRFKVTLNSEQSLLFVVCCLLFVVCFLFFVFCFLFFVFCFLFFVFCLLGEPFFIFFFITLDFTF